MSAYDGVLGLSALDGGAEKGVPGSGARASRARRGETGAEPRGLVGSAGMSRAGSGIPRMSSRISGH